LWCQTASGGFVRNYLFGWLEKSQFGPGAAVFLYLACCAYLVWIVGDARTRFVTTALVLILALYCSWFAKLSFTLLPVVLIVPVFVASWTIWEKTTGPMLSQNDGNHEVNAVVLFMALMLAFWMLFQGFFVQQIDFSFGMRFLSGEMQENREFVILYPLTLLKYGLPLALIVFIYVALWGVGPSQQTILAALIFCNLKLATLLLQSLAGPLQSHQKLYEFAMSDFIFVSQITVILAVSYLAILLATWVGQARSGARNLAVAVP
jgi:hypothetical protein